uniref:Otopetrin 3 n=1 Tax=Astyanax mexicanus TaxID=7994 RepID=A0A8B9JDN9_ASTMX
MKSVTAEAEGQELTEFEFELREGEMRTEDGSVLLWVPTGRRLVSGLLGLNVVLLGAALVAGDAFHPEGLHHQEPEVFLLLLMALSVAWMLWYLLWARKQPGLPPHTDHHAGGTTVTGIKASLFSVIWLFLQTYLLWAHSKDCIHKHRILTRNASDCHCGKQPVCGSLRKGYEVLYPFNMEFSLLAGCMLYVMWKNVGRHVTGTHSGHAQKITMRIVHHGGILLGPVLGLLVLITGGVIFVLYQVWVGQRGRRLRAFLLFYGFHLSVMPFMALCSLVGMLVYRRKERLPSRGRDRKHEDPAVKNPTRSLDVLLLVGSGLGQLSLSYFSLVAALAEGPRGILGSLDLSFSLLSLLELVLQTMFIIQGLQEHTHPHQNTHSNALLSIVSSDWYFCVCVCVCVQLWVIPAFGAHPQFESGVGKQFYGFSVWFVLVNLGQPLTVFYRMHSVGALMELLIFA